MYQTVQLSSCVSVQGEIVEVLNNGDVVVRDGPTIYRGRPMADDVQANPNEVVGKVANGRGTRLT